MSFSVDDLESHQFLAEVRKHAIKHLETNENTYNANLRLPRNKRKNVFKMPYEHHSINTFRGMIAIISTFERISHTLYYITDFRSSKKRMSAKINHHTWMEYHLSHYLSSVASIPDLCLILINYVYALGTPFQQCKEPVIIGNGNVSINVKDSYKALCKTLKDSRDLRNRDLHRAERPDIGELLKDPTYEIAELQLILGDTAEILDEELLSYYLRDSNKSLKTLLRIESQSILEAVQALWTELHIDYTHKNDFLRELSVKMLKDEIERRKKMKEALR